MPAAGVDPGGGPDAHAAALELSAANVTFERLGALLDMGIAENLLASG